MPQNYTPEFKKKIARRKKSGYVHEKPHKVFENKLKQDFHADSINQKWCTDFTCLFLKNGDIRYNCSIIDRYDRSVVASVTGRRITVRRLRNIFR